MVPAAIKLVCPQGLSSSSREQGFCYNNRGTRADKKFSTLGVVAMPLLKKRLCLFFLTWNIRMSTFINYYFIVSEVSTRKSQTEILQY